MFADPAGELLDRPNIDVWDHRRNIHGLIPSRFMVYDELLSGVLCCYILSFDCSLRGSVQKSQGLFVPGEQTRYAPKWQRSGLLHENTARFAPGRKTQRTASRSRARRARICRAGIASEMGYGFSGRRARICVSNASTWSNRPECSLSNAVCSVDCVSSRSRRSLMLLVSSFMTLISLP